MAVSFDPTGAASLPLTIRLGTPDDQLAVARLAALDSADDVRRLGEKPRSRLMIDGLRRGRVLLAEVEGQLRAAVHVELGSAIADPFYPSAHLVRLLLAHASGGLKASR
jgi:hypothetical protein